MQLKKRLLELVTVVAGVAILGATQIGYASDHDDGETDLKSRALNLSDHFTFKSGTDLAMIMYFNPRSLPGKQYMLSPNARYEIHISKVATNTSAPTAMDDFVFRFEAGAADATGAQPITLTVFKAGAMVGTNSGMSTTYAASKANTVVTNSATVGGIDVKYFVGMRADSFTFDVIRFFQVRAFLAGRFYGGANGNGNANATLANNCRGDAFLGGVLGNTETNPDADGVNLWNPPTCAPDFTKNLNVTSIALNVPIAELGGGTTFDTWSTISVNE